MQVDFGRTRSPEGTQVAGEVSTAFLRQAFLPPQALVIHAAFFAFIFIGIDTFQTMSKRPAATNPLSQFIILFLNDRIKKISNLESLTKLDVLDLHGNKVWLL